MIQPQTRCLILACGNTLRSDDGLGPILAVWAEERFQAEPEVRTIARQQWTPELAEDVARAESVLFIDCSVESAPGSVRLIPVAPVAASEGLATHHVGAPQLLALAQELFGSLPAHAMLLTVGAGSLELGENFSEAVRAAIPEAHGLLEEIVCAWLRASRHRS